MDFQMLCDCQTFSVPLTLRTTKTIEILLKYAEYYKIYIIQITDGVVPDTIPEDSHAL